MSIRPDQIPDLQVVGQRTGSKDNLTDKVFATHCPPDVQPQTRIVAICGITDYEDDASPNESGWFFSDFYLFFHLLQPDDTFPNTDSAKHLWLTSEPPRRLVEKYTEYAHGSPTSERRVVLEAPLLRGIENSGRLRVTGRLNLLQHFLSAIRDKSRLAAENKEPLLILVFGHGDEEMYGVSIGGEGKMEDWPKLRIEDVKLAIYPGAQVTLLITSCYSGGWLVRPDLNITGVAAASPDDESFSWPSSSSIGRASGSRVASSILQTLIKPEFARTNIQENPTYIRLSACIRDTLKDIDPLSGYSQMRFSAQDDEWEMEYRKRSGLPLLSYRNRWESLRLLRRGSLGDGSIPGPRRSIIERSLSRVGSVTGTPKRYALQSLARKYLGSFPGPDESGPNGALHRKLRQFLKNPKHFDQEQVESCFDQVSYRVDAMREADRIRAFMNLKFPSIFEFDVVEWVLKHPYDRETDALKARLFNLLRSKKLFDRPVGAGHGYAKPRQYLAIALIDSGLEWDKIEKAIDTAAKYKEELASAIFRKYRSVIDVRPEVWALRTELMGYYRKLQGHIQSLSPRRREKRNYGVDLGR